AAAVPPDARRVRRLRRPRQPRAARRAGQGGPGGDGLRAAPARLQRHLRAAVRRRRGPLPVPRARPGRPGGAAPRLAGGSSRGAPGGRSAPTRQRGARAERGRPGRSAAGGVPRGAGGVRILYLAASAFPLRQARAIQIAYTVAALAERGHAITLVVGGLGGASLADSFRSYGLAPPS